jgi:ubiquinone biosynthesis protein COQ9
VVRNGPIEVVDYAMDFWLEQTREELTKRQEEIQSLRIKERIHQGIKTRLELELPYEAFWPQAMALGMRPRNLQNTL